MKHIVRLATTTTLLIAIAPVADVVRTEHQSKPHTVYWPGASGPATNAERAWTECDVAFDTSYRLVLPRAAHRNGAEPMLLIAAPADVPYPHYQWGSHECYGTPHRCGAYPDDPFPAGWGRYVEKAPKPRTLRLFDRFGEYTAARPYFVRDQDETQLYGLEDLAHKTLFAKHWGLLAPYEWLEANEGEFRVAWWYEELWRFGHDHAQGHQWTELRDGRVVMWHRMDMEALAMARERIATCANRHFG